MQIWLKVEAGIVKAARFRTYGCPSAIACGEAVCTVSEGRELARAQALTAADVTHLVGGVPEGKEHCPAWRLDQGANTLQVTATTLDNVIVLGGVPGGSFRGSATFHGTGTPPVVIP